MNKGKYFRTAEMIGEFLAIMGLLLRLYDVNGADLLLLFGALTLAMLSLISGAFVSKELIDYAPVSIDQPLTELGRVVAILSGLSLSVTLVGVLFRLLHWPGWQPQLVGGLVGCGIMAVAGFFIIRPNEPKLYFYYGYRMLVLGGIGFTLINSSF